MKTNEFKCSICGQVMDNLDDYVTHVKECVDREKAEQSRKYLEEVNAAIKKVKTAKSYYEKCLNEFKYKYPKEYELNFANESAMVSDNQTKTVDELFAEAGKLVEKAVEQARDENMEFETLIKKMLLN